MSRIPATDRWAAETSRHLHEAADRVEQMKMPEKLGTERLAFANLNTQADDAIANLTGHGKISRDRCLYVIELDRAVDKEALRAAHTEDTAREDWKLPQANQNDSDVLYVGSSCATGKRKATLAARLRQHLTGMQKQTYALCLAQWARRLKGGVIVTAWQLASQGDDAEGDLRARKTVLAVEDWLAGELKPMLGHRGSRNWFGPARRNAMGAEHLIVALLPPGTGASFSATKHAGLARLEPLTAIAETWLQQYGGDEASWDGEALVLELRSFAELVDEIIAAGFTFERNALPS